MKKLLIGLLIAFIALPLSAAKKIVQDGIEYELFGTSSVRCRAKDKSRLTDVVIPINVKIGDRTYLVPEIDKDGFRDCKNLESVVRPDECKTVVNKGAYGFDNHGIFHGCTSLKRMRGTTKLYPAYMVFEALYKCQDVPFYAEVKDLDKNQLEAMTLTSNFYDFAYIFF